MPMLPLPRLNTGGGPLPGGPPCRCIALAVGCFLYLLAAAEVGALQVGTPQANAHLGWTLGALQRGGATRAALQQQQRQQVLRPGVQTPAFAAPLTTLRSLLRRKRKEVETEEASDRDSMTAECSSNSSISSNSNSGSTSNSNSNGTNSNSLSEATAEEILESALGASLALASQQLEGIRRQLHSLLLQQVLQQKTSKQGSHSELPVTELSAAAVAAAAKKRLREGAGETTAAADGEPLQRAETKVDAFVDGEVRGMFQQQMQQQILLLLQSFLSRGAAAAEKSQEDRSKERTPEQQLDEAAAAVTEEFETMLQQCVPSPQVREKWGCGELRQLLQQQLHLHAKALRLQRSEQQQQAETLLRVVQQQQGLLQQLQQQLQQEHQPRPFAMGAAYRVPNTNLQISAASRQGRLQLNVTCVPDDSPAAASGVLGQQGFVRGIESFGNLGLSCSFSV